MSTDRINALLSQKDKLEERDAKLKADQNRNAAKRKEILRKLRKETQHQKNKNLIEIGKIICASINDDPLQIDLEEFQDFINHTWLTYHSTGTPLTQKEGFYYKANNELWKLFKDETMKQYFIPKK